LEGNPPQFLKGEGNDAEVVTITPNAEDHCLAHVVKVEVDPFRGRMAIVRVHQGTLKKGGQIYIGDARKPLKVSHLLKLNGGEQTEVDSAVPGDICAIPRAEEIFFDAVLHDSHEEDHFHLKSIDLPPPMYGRAISARSDKEAQKANEALEVLCASDPSLKLEHIAAMNETILRGIGELHLRVALGEITAKYGIEVDTALPSIAYRETINASAEGHHRHKKQTGGAGQFGEVFLKVEPLPRGGGFEFVDQVVGGAIPSQFIPAVEKGIREVLSEGAISGHPLQDVRAIVYDGKHHSVDSKEIAFITAGKKAFIEAIANAKPVIMEPIVNVRITVPEACMGDVAGDLSSMRGSVKGTNMLDGGRIEIEGQAPLKDVQDYHTRLKSLSGGEGDFTMSFNHYAPVLPQEQEQMVKSFRREED
ncbi:MAG TPA: elongation factor G, partial [Pseudomonadales bacterium]|nr:elongation factor G [Pseudomonadales bacterium]